MKLLALTLLVTGAVGYLATPRGVVVVPVTVALFGHHTVTLPVSPAEYLVFTVQRLWRA